MLSESTCASAFDCRSDGFLETTLVEPSMDDYTVLRTIGEGSFGRALLVRRESSSQLFAMKEIRLPKVSTLGRSEHVLVVAKTLILEAQHRLSPCAKDTINLFISFMNL